jgi:hypothetical protein
VLAGNERINHLTVELCATRKDEKNVFNQLGIRRKDEKNVFNQLGIRFSKHGLSSIHVANNAGCTQYLCLGLDHFPRASAQLVKGLPDVLVGLATRAINHGVPVLPTWSLEINPLLALARFANRKKRQRHGGNDPGLIVSHKHQRCYTHVGTQTERRTTNHNLAPATDCSFHHWCFSSYKRKCLLIPRIEDGQRLG